MESMIWKARVGCLLVLLYASGALAAVYTVTKSADSGDGSLRWAIEAARTNPGADTIEFMMDPPYVIQPTSALPVYNAPDPLLINGASQFGFSGVPLVVVDGSLAGAASGLDIQDATSVVIRALNVTGWGSGLSFRRGSSNRVENCHVRSNGVNGLYLEQVQSYVIGGTTATQRNLIANNTEAGISLTGGGNSILGNRIGTEGIGRQPNSVGISLVGGSGNVIGGKAVGAGNVISGNDGNGIYFARWASNNTVIGNFIGTDVSGTHALTNDVGVLVEAPGSMIGGGTASERNLISGNDWGIRLSGEDAHNNVLSGNWIGLDATGGAAVPNYHGVEITLGAFSNLVGGTAAGDRNVVSGNNGDGVRIQMADSTNNRVQGNYIGVGPSGLDRWANGQFGVLVTASGTRIGGAGAGEGNVISGNGSDGLYVVGAGVGGVRIEGNIIGLDALGTGPMGNNDNGVLIGNAPDALIGGAGGGRNIIAANGDSGVMLQGGGCVHTVVADNYIGASPSSPLPFGNGWAGVHISWAPSNSIGTWSGDGNVIANNAGHGILVEGDESVGNRFVANRIYKNTGLGIDLGNDGVTPNDLLDADIGPNNRQNFPVLTLVSNDGVHLTVVGYLNGHTNEHYIVELFGNRSCDGTGHGEGEYYIGEVVADTDASGEAWFTNNWIVPPVPLPNFVTATARYVLGRETSEFSRYVMLDSDGDGMPDGWEDEYFGSPTGGDPNGHADGDGVPNLGEFLGDTIPNDGEDYPHMVRITSVGGVIRVENQTAATRVYLLEERDQLSPGSWNPYPPSRVGTGGAVAWDWPYADSNLFFRCAVGLP